MKNDMTSEHSSSNDTDEDERFNPDYIRREAFLLMQYNKKKSFADFGFTMTDRDLRILERWGITNV